MRTVSADHQPGEGKLAWPPSLPSSCLLEGVQDSPGAAQLVVVGLFADDVSGRQHTSKVGKSQRKPQEGSAISLGVCCFPPTLAPALDLEESGFPLMEQVIWGGTAQQMCPSSQTCADHKIIDPVIEIPALHLGPLLPALLARAHSPLLASHWHWRESPKQAWSAKHPCANTGILRRGTA